MSTTTLYDEKAFKVITEDYQTYRIAKVIFDLKEQTANVFNTLALKELGEVLQILQKESQLDGLLFLSGKKSGFVLGADVTEFLDHFKKSKEDLQQWIESINAIFTGFEDLPFPKVALINGFALGGGLEIALTMDYRLATTKASVGLPETKLGIIPGWGGTVRLPRMIGADNAIEWITSAKHYKSTDALKLGVIDGIIENEDQFSLEQRGLDLLEKCLLGELDWKKRVQQKKNPLQLNPIESTMSFEGSKAFIASKAGPNYPAPLKAVENMQKGALLNQKDALKIEAETFAFCAHTQTAESLVQVFLGDQYLKKLSKQKTSSTTPIEKAAVLGAGIMGGGISYQSAVSGVPALMKDIKQEQLDLGMREATKILQKSLDRKKISTEKMSQVISSIHPTLSYAEIDSCSFIIEAVIENYDIKSSVLREVEDAVDDETIIASNTSTISITKLASSLKRPEKFCGMHFFNPVHRMPLVEIIKGEKTSEDTISKAVLYALQMGKTPIVVNDCAGFLVNRILFPYFKGFVHLVEDGVDFRRIDKVMEKFGWPMGPAYLLDVVGIDTGVHALKIMASAFPDRMAYENKTVLESLFEKNRLGQKNGLGFYDYHKDKKGRLVKNVNNEIIDFVASLSQANSQAKKDVSDDDIIMRMMIPMITESARCLEDGIVQSATEVDMGLLLGLGFPPFRGGALKYADHMGLVHLFEKAQEFEHLGKIYEFSPQMISMTKNQQLYYKS